MSGQRRKLITELTFTGETRIGRAFAEAHVAATKLKGRNTAANNSDSFLRVRFAEYLRLLQLAGIPVEAQTRAPRSQLPPPKPPVAPVLRDHRMTDTEFSAGLSKGPRTLRQGKDPDTAVPALCRVRARPGYELVRVVVRSSASAPSLDSHEAREVHGGLDDAKYLGCDGVRHLFERKKGAA